MITTFIIPHDSGDFTVHTSDITITIPGSAICTITPTIHFTGEPVYISVHPGEVLDTTIIIIPLIIAADIITDITHLMHSAGDIAHIIMALIIQDTTTASMMVTGEDPITMTMVVTAIMDIAHPVLPCHLTDQQQAMQVLQQGKITAQMIPATDHQVLLPM